MGNSPIVGWWCRTYEWRGQRRRQIGCIVEDATGQRAYNAIAFETFLGWNEEVEDAKRAADIELASELLTAWAQQWIGKDAAVRASRNAKQLAECVAYLTDSPLSPPPTDPTHPAAHRYKELFRARWEELRPVIEQRVAGDELEHGE